FFCKPGTDLEWFDYWKNYCAQWLYDLGISKENLRLRDHDKEELAFYSKATTDFEYNFAFGFGELWGIADRTDYDLSQHAKFSGKTIDYLDPETNERYVPYVIEPSLGADRVLLAFMTEAYDEEKLEGGDTRVVMHFHPALAPYKCAILPLQKKLGDKAREIYANLSKYFMVDYDETGSIGKRYRREDEIGTPYCITVDFDTMENDTVTIRNRDTMQQERIHISEIKDYIEKSLMF
ncbi:MAG: glycine--tRNA ligase, partial [Oscillospiraceae bacterium]|nr:glycine--tRNA ligase [Oscillospiraceae bacterium]